MSTYSGNIGREEEDGGGWGGLVPDREERMEQKMPKLVARICGGNEHFMPETVGGCGCEIGFDDEYRCVDCGVYFHKTCIRVHWDKKVTQDDVDRESTAEAKA